MRKYFNVTRFIVNIFHTFFKMDHLWGLKQHECSISTPALIVLFNSVNFINTGP